MGRKEASGPWRSGIVVSWRDEKGYGFLRPDTAEKARPAEADGAAARGPGSKCGAKGGAKGGDVFIHVSAFGRSGERPGVGDRVRFRMGPGRDGRPSAVQARLAARPLTEIRFLPRLQRREGRIAGAAALALLALGAVIFGEAPPELLGPYVAMGAMSITLYRTDKAQSVSGGWRVPETTLHATDLIFGVIGGLLAQGWLGHKTSKPGYLGATAVIAVGHALLLVAAAFGEPSPDALDRAGDWIGRFIERLITLI